MPKGPMEFRSSRSDSAIAHALPRVNTSAPPRRSLQRGRSHRLRPIYAADRGVMVLLAPVQRLALLGLHYRFRLLPDLMSESPVSSPGCHSSLFRRLSPMT